MSWFNNKKEPVIENQAEIKEPVSENKAETKEPVSENQAEIKEPVSENQCEIKEPVSENQTEIKEPVIENQAETKEPVSENQLIKCIKNEIAPILKDTNLIKLKIENELKVSESKEKTIDALHNELESFRKQSSKNLIKGFAIDIIKLINGYEDKINHLNKDEDLVVINEYKEVIEDLEDILETNGISKFESIDKVFDVTKQKHSKLIHTTDKEMNKTIANKNKSGYQWEDDDKIISKESVDIYVYKEEEK